AIARIVNPDIYIIVRTRYLGEVDDLHALGANEVIPEEFVASVEIFSRVLNIYNVPRNVIDDHIEDIRKGGYMALRKMDTARRLLSEELPMLSEIVTESYLLKGPSRFVGRSISDLRLRSKTGATVMAIKRGETVYQNPDADFVFEEGDIILLVGRPSDIGRAVEYIETDDGANTS
ncbi:MAG: sodium:proton exchanger, partial [Armatimonadetes bacterium]|nr:sodium:proton exchanger [Armatimonadota bacterium]